MQITPELLATELTAARKAEVAAVERLGFLRGVCSALEQLQTLSATPESQIEPPPQAEP